MSLATPPMHSGLSIRRPAVHLGKRSVVVLMLASLTGLVMFAWPFWIPAHPYSTHFMDIKSRCLAAVVRADICTSCYFHHFCGLLKKVPEQFFIIIIIPYRSDQLRNSPGVLFIGAQPDMVGFFGNGFSLHHHKYSPSSGFCNG